MQVSLNYEHLDNALIEGSVLFSGVNGTGDIKL